MAAGGVAGAAAGSGLGTQGAARTQDGARSGWQRLVGLAAGLGTLLELGSSEKLEREYGFVLFQALRGEDAVSSFKPLLLYPAILQK